VPGWLALRIIFSFFCLFVPVVDLIILGASFRPCLCAVHGQVLAQWPQMFRILDLFGMFVPISMMITHIVPVSPQRLRGTLHHRHQKVMMMLE